MAAENKFDYDRSDSEKDTQSNVLFTEGPISSYKYSKDELRAFQECTRESFYRRSVPMSILFGFAALVAMDKGYLKPSRRFGVYPNVILASLFGQIAGRLSYQRKCAEKLKNLPDSHIGQLLREQAGGNTENSNADKMAEDSELVSEEISERIRRHRIKMQNYDAIRPYLHDIPYADGDFVSYEKPRKKEKPTEAKTSYENLRDKNRKQ